MAEIIVFGKGGKERFSTSEDPVELVARMIAHARTGFMVALAIIFATIACGFAFLVGLFQ